MLVDRLISHSLYLGKCLVHVASSNARPKHVKLTACAVMEFMWSSVYCKKTTVLHSDYNQITCLYKYKTDLIIKLNHISLSGIVIELIIIKTISQLASNTFIHMPILIVTLICCLASVHFRLCVYHFLIKLFFNNSLWLGIGKTCPFYTLDVRVKLAFIWCFKKGGISFFCSNKAHASDAILQK